MRHLHFDLFLIIRETRKKKPSGYPREGFQDKECICIVATLIEFTNTKIQETFGIFFHHLSWVFPYSFHTFISGLYEGNIGGGKMKGTMKIVFEKFTLLEQDRKKIFF